MEVFSPGKLHRNQGEQERYLSIFQILLGYLNPPPTPVFNINQPTYHTENLLCARLF